MTYIDPKGRRVTMETAYLTPAVLARPNLTVATNAYVNRVLFDTEHSSTPRAVGVEFSDAAGTKFQARARREVVLSYVVPVSSLLPFLTGTHVVLAR